MMKKILLAAAALSAFVAGSPAVAAPGGQNTFTINIVGYVPVICRATVSSSQVPITGSQTSLGQLSQFCNDPNGYQVWVDYSPALAGSSVLVDGQAVSLTSSGSTMITASTGPSIVQHNLAIALADPSAQAAVSFRVVPL